MALLVGVGAAAVVGGALIGTLLPQAQSTIDGFDVLAAGNIGEAAFRLLGGVIILVGTVFTLASFHFSAGRAADGTPKRNRVIEGVAWVGRIFIAITLGALFAGVYLSALTAMIERLSSIIDFIRGSIGF
jgi:heme/copper-type cytochrome/quinol oxidase subunit 2